MQSKKIIQYYLVFLGKEFGLLEGRGHPDNRYTQPYLTAWRQARVVQRHFHQLYQKIQHFTQTISYIEEAFLEGTQTGNFPGYIKTQHFAIVM